MIEVNDYVYHIEDRKKKLRVTSVGIFNITAVEETTGITLRRSSAEFELWPTKFLGRDWGLIDYLTVENWTFVPDPFSGGVIGQCRGALLSPDMADEIFEGLQRFFEYHGRDRVQYVSDCQHKYMYKYCRHPPSMLAYLYPEEYKKSKKEERELATDIEPVPKKVDHHGFVYVLRTSNHLFKIGRSKNPAKRLRQLNSDIPYELEPVVFIETDDMYKLEEELHEKFADRRKKGEWFRLRDRDIEYLTGLVNEENL